MKLNKKQRKFLEYLRHDLKCLGYTITIPDMLKNGEYSKTQITFILRTFNELKNDGSTHKLYGKVLKYLK